MYCLCSARRKLSDARGKLFLYSYTNDNECVRFQFGTVGEDGVHGINNVIVILAHSKL